MHTHGSFSSSDRPVAPSNASGLLSPPEPFAPPPVLTERGYSLTLHPGNDRDFTAWLNFPGRRGPAYPLCGHRAIAEFREMLTTIDPSGEDSTVLVRILPEADHRSPLKPISILF